MAQPQHRRPHSRPRACFLYIAQAHQTFHSISAAVELARLRPDVEVELCATSPETVAELHRLLAVLGAPQLAVHLLGPGWLRAFASEDGAPPKVPMLLANAPRLAGYDVVVAPERTTAALRLLGVRRTRLVYTQHGAGDRGGPFEPRLRQFDLVFSAGRKQADRMAHAGLVPPERCAVVGYPKFDVVDALHPSLPRLFDNDRPVVLYNPHFDPRLSSWSKFGLQVLAAFAAQDRYNLIFAPHIRLFGACDPVRVEVLRPFVGVPCLHLDLGSPAAIDMTYTTLADVYLGDASSQIYEFLRVRRPCLFLDAHGSNWRGQESYRHWTFGPVIDSAVDIVAEVDRARASHAEYLPVQEAGFAETFDLTGESSSVRAARAIGGLIPEVATPDAGR